MGAASPRARLALLLCVLCWPWPASALSPEDTIGQIRQDRIAISGVSLGTTEAAVTHALGQPIRSTKSNETTTYEFPGLKVAFIEGVVASIECISPKYATAEGPKVGDQASAFLRRYGPAVRTSAPL